MSLRSRFIRWTGARPSLVLFVLIASLYAMTAGSTRDGFGYSADGSFAFEMARSAVVDPGHVYLRTYSSNFSRWGVGLPIAFAPLVAFAEPIAQIAPQRDRVPVGEHEILLVNYAPLGGSDQLNVTRELDLGLTPGAYDELVLLSHSALSADIPQGVEIARLLLVGADGARVERSIRVGIETAEWAYDRADVRAVVQHDRPTPAANHLGNTRANYYAAAWTFDPPIDLAEASLTYLVDTGNLYVDGVATRGLDGAWVDGPGIGRVWSERQNAEFFLRLWTPLANVLITALGVVLLFKIAQRMGYSVRIALVVALVYAVGTMAWPYAVYDFAEPLVTTLLLAAVWLVMLQRDTGLARYAALAGVVGMAALASKYVTFIAIPVLAIYLVLQHKPGRTWSEVWRRGWRPLAYFVAPFVLVAPAVLLAAALVFDVRLLYERELIAGIGRGWLDLPFALGFHGLVTSWGKGILWYNPVLLVAVPVIPWFIRRHGWRSFVFAAIPVVYLLLYSKKQVWYGGNGWGSRYLVPTLPYLIVMGAPLIAWIGGRSRRFVPALALSAVLVASVGVQLLGVSKDFTLYLNLFQQQVAGAVPENGAVYGGQDYQPWSSTQPEGDFAAVLYAHQFSPLLAHAWLLRADAAQLLIPDRLDVLEDLLRRTPWSRFGVDAAPARPAHGLGLDFWSMVLSGHYLAHRGVLVWVGVALVAIQLVSISALALLARRLWPSPGFGGAVRLIPVGAYGALLVFFDTLHFML